jgi:hypothetical protein
MKEEIALQKAEMASVEAASQKGEGSIQGPAPEIEVETGVSELPFQQHQHQHQHQHQQQQQQQQQYQELLPELLPELPPVQLPSPLPWEGQFLEQPLEEFLDPLSWDPLPLEQQQPQVEQWPTYEPQFLDQSWQPAFLPPPSLPPPPPPQPQQKQQTSDWSLTGQSIQPQLLPEQWYELQKYLQQ